MEPNEKGFRFKDTFLVLAITALIASAFPINPQIYQPAGPKQVVNTLLGRKPKTDVAEAAPRPAPVVKRDIYEGWGLYSNDTAKISLRFPPGWNVSERLPKSEATAGHYLNLTISQVDQEQRLVDPSPYEKELGLYINFDTAKEAEKDVTPTRSLFGKLGPSDQVLELIEVNGADYTLVGVKESRSSPIVQVEMMLCLQNKSCSWHIKRPDGSYADFTIASQGNIRRTKYAVDLTSDDYAAIKLVLKSLKF